MTPQIKQRIEQIRRGEVPEGYKKTKAGTIPFEWDLHPLSKHLIESRIPGTNGAIAKKLTVKLWNKGVFEKREVHEGSESTTYYKRKSGQLIYSKLDFLNCAFGIIPEHLDGYESTQDLPCFDVKGVIPNYLLTYVTQRNFYMHFGMIADGGRKARRVGPEDMLSFPLVYPPLAEQEKIAEILQTQDKLIELQQMKIDELKRLKKVYLSKMFPKKGCNVPEIRFPGFTAPWEQRKLEDYLSVSNEKNTSDVYGRADVLSVSGDFGIVNQIEFQGRSFAGASVSNYGVVQTGDVVYTKSPLNSNPYGIIKTNKGKAGIVSTLYAVYHPRETVFPDFVQVYFEQHARMNNYMHPLVNKGAKNDMKVSAENALKGPVCFPSYAEQRTISAFFSVLDNLITLHQRKLDEEQKRKKALMQLLLTGIVRVEVKQ